MIYKKKEYKISNYRVITEVILLKKFVCLVLILMLSAVYPLYSFFVLNSYKNEPSPDVQKGIEALNKLDSVDQSSVQNNLNEIESERLQFHEALHQNEAAEKTIKKIESGKLTYRKVFSNVYFAGDSLMKGLEDYQILNSNHIFAEVSASLFHLEENFKKIVSAEPKILILHYGLNMIATDELHLNIFIDQYTKLSKKFKKSLPNTRIVVSLLFPVDTSVATAARFKKINKYNKRLIKMCNSQKIEYLDSASVFKGHKDFYGADGIHLSAAFYSKYWLKHIIRELGIYR